MGPLLALLPIVAQAQDPVQARRADDFIHSIGVGTHWEYGDTPYGLRFAEVFQKLRESGIRHVRGQRRAAEMTTAGIASTFTADVADNVDGTFDNTVRPLLAQLKARLAAGENIDFVEGPNEPDLFWGNRTYNGQGRDQDGGRANLRGVVLFMRDMYAAIKADPATRHLSVMGPSVTRTRGTDFGAGELKNYVDYGNFHPYCSGNSHTFPAPYAGMANYWWHATHPSANLTDETTVNKSEWLFQTAQRPFGPKAMTATETGYSTWRGGPSEAVHAKYMPRLFLEYFRLGIVRTYSYEFVDEFADPAKTDREANFGLLRHDLTPKPAFTALKSLIGLLADPGAGDFAPATLAYEVRVTPPAGYDRTQYVKHQLFQKRNGAFYLVLYHEISGEDSALNPNGTPKADGADGPSRVLTHPAMPTTITLPASIQQATVYTYDTSFGFRAAPAAIAGRQLTVNVQDQVLVIELKAGVSAPAPAFDGTYRLVARHSAKTLAITGGSLSDGAAAIQQSATGSLGQQWQVTPTTNGYYRLLARHSGKALDVSTSSLANGAKVQQWTDNGSPAQRWKIEPTTDGYYTLTAECSGKVLDVSNASDADGAAVHQWDYVGATNQQWKLELVLVTASRPAATTAAASAEAGLQAYPNPSRGQATLAFSAATAQRVTVYVHDQQGRLVTLLTVPAQAGRTDFRLPATLRPGLYHLRARIDGQPQQFTLQVE